MIIPLQEGHTELDLQAFGRELDGYFEDMVNFRREHPSEIFMKLAGFTARVSQIRSLLVRDENKSKRLFRTREIDPFLKECDRQFKVWSRLVSVRQSEWEMNKPL